MLHYQVTAVRHLAREKRPVKNTVEYLPDETVDDTMDQRIRDLLTTCFTGPNDVVFQTRRYFAEPYPHRWIIRDGDRLAAHLGVHEKRIEVGDESVPVAGVAEVCVHPDQRGKGHVKNILKVAHAWMRQYGFVYSVLLGDPRVYGSSGYVSREDVSFDVDGERQCLKGVMVLPLTDRPWPEGGVYLPGPGF